VPGNDRRRLVEAIGVGLDQGLGDRGMQPRPAPGRHGPVGDLLGKGVPEAVLGHRIALRLLEQFRGAQR
jgi:hypothetical protein